MLLIVGGPVDWTYNTDSEGMNIELFYPCLACMGNNDSFYPFQL